MVIVVNCKWSNMVMKMVIITKLTQTVTKNVIEKIVHMVNGKYSK